MINPHEIELRFAHNESAPGGELPSLPLSTPENAPINALIDDKLPPVQVSTEEIAQHLSDSGNPELAKLIQSGEATINIVE